MLTRPRREDMMGHDMTCIAWIWDWVSVGLVDGPGHANWHFWDLGSLCITINIGIQDGSVEGR